jgi:hypothetical protein
MSAWAGPKGPKAYNMGHDFLKDPDNMTLALQYLRLFQEGMGSSVWKGELADLCEPWWPTMAGALAKQGFVLMGIHGICPPNVPDVSTACPRGLAVTNAALGSPGRFNGFSTLENGARYLINAAENAWTAELTSEAQSFVQEEYFTRFAALNMQSGAGAYYVLATSNSGVHRWAATGQATLIASESLVESGNVQVSYAWNRGAAKQYGVHIGSQVNNKVVNKVPASLSLIKRVLFTEVLYGSLVAEIGGGDWGITNNGTVDALGRLQKATQQFFTNLSRTRAGDGGAVSTHMLGGYVHVTPVAFVHDAGSGWATPCAMPNPFRRLRNIPFGRNDYLLDGLLNVTFPGYVGGLWFSDESRAMTRTPFSDMLDVITDDAPSWLLQRYDLVVLTSSMRQHPRATATQLAAAIEAGTNVVITADALATLGEFAVPILGVQTATGWLCQKFKPGTQINIETSMVVEVETLSLCPFETAANVVVRTLATEILTNTTAAIVVTKSTSSNGSLTVLLANEFGTAANSVQTGNFHQCPRPNMNFTSFEPQRPYTMLKHTKRILMDMIYARSLLSVDGGAEHSDENVTSELASDRNRLSYIVLANGTTDYLVAITNPTWDVQSFALRPGPALGNVHLAITELHVDESERAEADFAAPGFVAAVARDPSSQISGGAYRVFRVSVRSHDNPASFPSALAPNLPRPVLVPSGRWLRFGVGSMRPNLMAAIVARPSFALHFDGVVVPWHYVAGRDDAYLKEDANFAAARRLHLAVDMTSAMAPFPHWRLCNNGNDTYGVAADEYRRSLNSMSELLRKMSILNARDLLMSLHKSTSQACDATMLDTVRILGGRAQAAGVRLHIRHSAKAGGTGKLGELMQFVRNTTVDPRWLRVAPSLAVLIDDPRKSTAAALQQLNAENNAQRGMLLLLSTRALGTDHACLAPLLSPGGSTFNASSAIQARELLSLSGNATFVFDAAFCSKDEELLDVSCLMRLL